MPCFQHVGCGLHFVWGRVWSVKRGWGETEDRCMRETLWRPILSQESWNGDSHFLLQTKCQQRASWISSKDPLPELLLNLATRGGKESFQCTDSIQRMRTAIREESFLHLGLSQWANSVLLDSGHCYATFLSANTSHGICQASLFYFYKGARKT